MANLPADVIGPVSLDELDAILIRAREEKWTELAVIPTTLSDVYIQEIVDDYWPPARIIRLSDPIGVEGARALATLTNLTSLNLNNNSIGVEGARALATLTNLTSLNLNSNSIGVEGARALATLTNLTSLDLYRNSIGDEGARALATLTNLTSLDLYNNSIGDEGARALATLTNLTSLNLNNNSIGVEGARALATLTNLTSLDLYNNSIGVEGARAVLDCWVARSDTARLHFLDLRANGDIECLPPETLQTTDAAAILAAYRRFQSAAAADTLQPFNEAKLLVVGNEAVGKTSLIRYLIRNEPRNPSEKKTPGAAIHEKIETQHWPLEDKDLTLNVWDFGGQEIMHGTHTFFLTERSLYLLVLEARREDDRSIHDWLRTIRNRGGDSPVIVVINKCDNGSDNLGLDEKRLREDDPGIVAFVRTSCDAGASAAQSIAALRQVIADTLTGHDLLEDIRRPFPAPYLRIRNAVGERARNNRLLLQQDFVRLCEETDGDPDNPASEPITAPEEQRLLLRLLHDLGVVVAHGLIRDATAAEREITLLDPNWLTTAIYSILNSPTVADQSGEFSRSQLDELLDPSEYPHARHEFIIDMMEHAEVGLCFELPGTDHQRYLIPAALRKNEPEYADIWPEQDSLHFRFEYEFLPPTMLARFIVESHRHMTSHATRWRTGVVLSIQDCPVLVRADRENKRIDILVTGRPDRRDYRGHALSIVRGHFHAVHKLNPECGALAVVPLPDQPDVAVSVDHLLGLRKKAGPDYEYFPDGADRGYTVRELLQPVHPGGDYSPRKTAEPQPVAAIAPAAATIPAEPSPSSTAIRDIALLLLATTASIAILLVVVDQTDVSGWVIGSIGIIVTLLFLLILAFVAVRSGLLPKTQFAKLLEATLKKIPVLSALLPGSKKNDPD